MLRIDESFKALKENPPCGNPFPDFPPLGYTGLLRLADFKYIALNEFSVYMESATEYHEK